MTERVFADTTITQGQPLQYLETGTYPPSVEPYAGGNFAGISLCDMLEFDFSRDIGHNGRVDGIMSIMTQGKIVLPVKARAGDSIYVTKKGNFKTKEKKSRKLIGKAISSSDLDGFCVVQL